MSLSVHEAPSEISGAEETMPAIQSVTQEQHLLKAVWDNETESVYHYLWLRDNCPTAFHPQTKERSFDLLSVSEDIHPIAVSINEGSLRIEWSEDEHISEYDQSWLYEHNYSAHSSAHHSTGYQSWDCSFASQIPQGDHEAVMSSDEALFKWMSDLDRYGLAIINGMPDSEEAVVNTAQRIDYLRQTNFGMTFDVVSVEEPINLAYTSISLPLHTDLANQETPPGYQFLHCLANESEGGESTFVDGLKVAEELRSQCPDHFKLLSEYAVPFRFHDSEHDIRQHHTVINLDNFGNIIEIKYNAHLADIFDLPAEVMHEYYLAYRNLMARFKDERFKIEIKLQGGQMVVFDNRRVLHGRNKFETSSGRRHLRGCYVDRSEFRSRLRVLGRMYQA